MSKKRYELNESSIEIIKAYCLEGYPPEEIVKLIYSFLLFPDIQPSSYFYSVVENICSSVYESNVQKLLRAHETKIVGEYLAIDRKHRKILSCFLKVANVYKNGLKTESLSKAVRKCAGWDDNLPTERILRKYLYLLKRYKLLEPSPYGKGYVKLSEMGRKIAEFIIEIENFLYKI